MDFSIVIPVLNEEKRLPACLEALKNQDYPKDKYEIIIVDNGSTDKSVEIVQSFINNENPRVVIIHEPKKGITFARQAGLESAKGRYYISTDADAIPPKDWLKNAKSALEITPDTVGATGPTYGYDSNFIFNWLMAVGGVSAVKAPRGKAVMGCNMAMKTEVAKSVGGFVLGENKYHEDSIISVRLKKVGKINVDKKFKIYVSSRRYRGWRVFYIFNNIINYFGVRLINRPLFDFLPEIR